MKVALTNRGVQAALLSAVLFGAGTPLAKLLLGNVSPWMLAGLLYCGSGLGLTLIRLIRRAPRVHLAPGDLLPLAGAIAAVGVAGPVLLMLGLANMPASGASLLLNAEGVVTAVLAWFVFRENFDRRIALGTLAIVAGAVVLSVPSGANFGSHCRRWRSSARACAGASTTTSPARCLFTDATWLAAIKGVVAGPVNLILAFTLRTTLPAWPAISGALVVGFFAYGVSLALFIVGMRHVGTARAGAYYSIAPFFGAVLAFAFGDRIAWPFIIAGVLMAIGVWLHLTERHEHTHTHQPLTHDHWHTHDEHHQHEHDEPVPAGTWHKHEHHHELLTHTHEHYPDAHHRHAH
ncbi:DMT family transporter [Curtobacterium sp. VKM Ac-1376]|uniref:DMT family transporter n=1 Tax=Curtobacterium sp. VKM Ac-1376 TaxID=123312 RepID=UPI001E2AB47A|nr:DMT family transporter [Curtobacterium sp. VKM Ac-1376]